MQALRTTRSVVVYISTYSQTTEIYPNKYSLPNCHFIFFSIYAYNRGPRNRERKKSQLNYTGVFNDYFFIKVPEIEIEISNLFNIYNKEQNAGQMQILQLSGQV